MDENIRILWDELSRLNGPARVPKLMRLGQELLARCSGRTGPGRPTAFADLSAAIEVWDEAYRLSEPGDPARGEAAAQLGWLLTARHATHEGGPEDRETAIVVLGEALTVAELPPRQATMARLALGQLLFARAAGARGGFPTGVPHDARDDMDEAIRLFRSALDGPPPSAEAATLARTLLAVAESTRPLLSGDLAAVDISKITATVSMLLRLRRDGVPSTPWIPEDPSDGPVSVVPGEAHHSPTVPPQRLPPATTVPAEPDSARRTARDRLAALVADHHLPAWEQAHALLLAGPPQRAADDLDAFVEAAADAVDADGDDDPVESGLDRLLLAVGLCLRERHHLSGWEPADEDATGGDRRAAAQHLSTATALVPPDHPAAAVVVEAIGGLLDDSRPLSGSITQIADRLSGYAEEITARPPTVTALAELCRTVAALRAGSTTDPDAFAAAVAAVPAEHPLRRTLSTAVDHARLAAAVRVGGPITPGPALGGLADLLDALLRDDRTALQTALDAAPRRNSPRLRAVLGAIHLRLGRDLGAAVTLLSEATRALDDGGLRTRTWWRLAEAYRARGATGDDELSRDAGLTALRGPAPDQRDAARFATWMLAEGRGTEAFTALEIAAATPEPPSADPLALDLLSVLVGVTPQAAPPVEPPGPAAVAAGLREIGAAALLYLHPTDDAGRTTGVLCLDSATDRLDVLANLPVTDPLTSDDPGWPAILRRWASEHIVVAATGDLTRLALAAVRTGDGRYLAQDVVVSHVSSGGQVVPLAARSFRPVDAEPLFVVNPRGDRDPDMAEVTAVRRLFY
ncbi:hypothetical protein E1091_07130, partial [Micromonospora fluostatini]